MAQLLSYGDFHPECQLRLWMGKEKTLDFPSTLARRENCFPGPCTQACPNLFPKLGKENHMMRLISQPFVLPHPECDSADTEVGEGGTVQFASPLPPAGLLRPKQKEMLWTKACSSPDPRPGPLDHFPSSPPHSRPHFGLPQKGKEMHPLFTLGMSGSVPTAEPWDPLAKRNRWIRFFSRSQRANESKMLWF